MPPREPIPTVRYLILVFLFAVAQKKWVEVYAQMDSWFKLTQTGVRFSYYENMSGKWIPNHKQSRESGEEVKIGAVLADLLRDAFEKVLTLIQNPEISDEDILEEAGLPIKHLESVKALRRITYWLSPKAVEPKHKKLAASVYTEDYILATYTKETNAIRCNLDAKQIAAEVLERDSDAYIPWTVIPLLLIEQVYEGNLLEHDGQVKAFDNLNNWIEKTCDLKEIWTMINNVHIPLNKTKLPPIGNYGAVPDEGLQKTMQQIALIILRIFQRKPSAEVADKMNKWFPEEKLTMDKLKFRWSNLRGNMLPEKLESEEKIQSLDEFIYSTAKTVEEIIEHSKTKNGYRQMSDKHIIRKAKLKPANIDKVHWFRDYSHWFSPFHMTQKAEEMVVTLWSMILAPVGTYDYIDLSSKGIADRVNRSLGLSVPWTVIPPLLVRLMGEGRIGDKDKIAKNFKKLNTWIIKERDLVDIWTMVNAGRIESDRLPEKGNFGHLEYPNP